MKIPCLRSYAPQPRWLIHLHPLPNSSCLQELYPFSDIPFLDKHTQIFQSFSTDHIFEVSNHLGHSSRLRPTCLHHFKKKRKNTGPKIQLLTSCHWTEISCTLRVALLISHLLFLFHFPGTKASSFLLRPSPLGVTDSLTRITLQFYNLSAFILIYFPQCIMFICSSSPMF